MEEIKVNENMKYCNSCGNLYDWELKESACCIKCENLICEDCRDNKSHSNDYLCSMCRLSSTPYDFWNETLWRVSDHLMLSAILREYYDEIDRITVQHVPHESFAEENFRLEMKLNSKLETNDVWDLYILRQEKNQYIAKLKNIIIKS